MRFEWDEAKRLSNIRRHGFDFLDAEKILAGETFSIEDDRFDYGEIRSHLGHAQWNSDGRCPYAVNEVTRVISLRKASKNEEELYYAEIRD